MKSPAHRQPDAEQEDQNSKQARPLEGPNRRAEPAKFIDQNMELFIE
jgi:hypothetical protein